MCYSLSVEIVSIMYCQLALNCSYSPNSTKGLAAAAFEYDSVKSMANTVGSCGYTGDASTDDGNLRPAKVCTWCWSCCREDLVQNPLYELVDEENWMAYELLE
jgi:hypothetical protein